MIPLGQQVCADVSERALIFARSIFQEVRGGAGVYYFSTESAFIDLPAGLAVESLSLPANATRFISHCIAASSNLSPDVYYLPYHVTVYEEQSETSNPSTRQYATEGTLFIEVHVLPPVVTSADVQGLIAFTARWNHSGVNEPSGENIYLLSRDGSRLGIFTTEGATQPAWSPAGTQIAYTAVRRGIREGIFVGDVDSGEHLQLTEEGHSPVWSPDGTQIAYADRGITIINLDTMEPVNLTPDYYSDEFSWSPDGSQIVFQADDKLYVVAVQSRTVTPLVTDEALVVAYPAWSPIDNQIAFLLRRANETSGLFVINSDGSGLMDLTPTLDLGRLLSFARPPAWSPDGSRLVFGDKSELFVQNAEGTALITLNSADGRALWLPDGGQLAFVWDRDVYRFGDRQIYLIDPNGNNLTQITNENVISGGLVNSFLYLAVQP